MAGGKKSRLKSIARQYARHPAGSPGGQGGRFAPKNNSAAAVSRTIIDGAKAVEPAVTQVLMATAKAGGGQMVGLKNRLKEHDSLTRKIQTKSDSSGLPPDQIRITDALRYTMQLDEKSYSNGIRSAIDNLAQRGVKMVELENNWEKGDAYNGVNALFEKDGSIFELQFHTEASMAAKSQAHKHYEEFRLPSTTPKRKKELFDEMVIIADSAPQPDGIIDLGIGVMRFRPFKPD
jgi:hypothetical protein